MMCIVIGLLVSPWVALVAGRRTAAGHTVARIVWGTTPVINYKYWAKAMRDAGHESETVMHGFYGAINNRADFDHLVEERFANWPEVARRWRALWWVLMKFDVFVISCDGFLFANTTLWRFEAWLLRLAAKKVVVFPYGGDAFAYRDLGSVTLAHALMMSYPEAARNQDAIAARLAYWMRHADCVIPGMMGPDGFGRWDLLAPSSLAIDLDAWKPTRAPSGCDGRNGRVTVAHAPNHRGFKGTEFVMDAVERLQREGLDVELLLLERIQNTQVRQMLQERTDILVEQVIATGHGINAVEGMACGLPVVCNLEDERYTTPMRRWSFLGECPIVSASPETVVDQLRKLVMRPDLRKALGEASRRYAERHHGFDAFRIQFTAVLEYLYGERETLLNFYHPLIGESARDPAAEAIPLVQNRIPD